MLHVTFAGSAVFKVGGDVELSATPIGPGTSRAVQSCGEEADSQSGNHEGDRSGSVDD